MFEYLWLFFVLDFNGEIEPRDEDETTVEC